MLEVTCVRVRSLSLDYNHVTWEVTETNEDVLDYTTQILRSEAASGPYEAVTQELSDVYSYIDSLVKVGNIYRQYHYKLLLKNKATKEAKEFGPFEKTAEPTLIANTLRMHLNLLMHEFIGRRCWLLPVRTFGQRCGDCWNPRLQKRRISGCRTCFDTSFVRGYHRPVEIWISIDPAPKAQQPTNLGRTQQQSTTARMSYYPPVKPDDLLIEPENLRWVVRSVASTEEQRVVITQELTLSRVETSNVEFLVPLELGVPLEKLDLTPARQFSNPTTLDSDNIAPLDFPGIFSIYPFGGHHCGR